MKKVKVLLVYPTIPMMLVTPLAIAIFTWIIKKKGHAVELFDTTNYLNEDFSSPENRIKFLQARNTGSDIFKRDNLRDINQMKEDYRNKLINYNPDLILYSFTEDSLLRALELLKISNSCSSAPAILGGIVATSDPEWLMSFPEVKIIAPGEGEETVSQLLDRISEDKPIDDVKSLWIKQKNGEIIRNEKTPFINLENYSADFSLFEKERFVRPMGGRIFKAAPLETYRGCPNKCTYCNSPFHNTAAKQEGTIYLRRRSVQNIRQEIKYLTTMNDIDFIYIVDDDFLARPTKEIYEFIKMYDEFKIPFWFNTRAEHVAKDILIGLKQVGMFRVSFGIESGNESFRRNILGRGTSNKELIRKFEIIAESGISYSINVIIGFPFENRALIFDTINLLKQIKGYDSITVSIFTPYHGTVLRDVAIKNGMLDPDRMTIHTTSHSILNIPGLSSSQIDGLMKTFPLYVAFDESHHAEIEKIEKFNDPGNNLFDKYSKMYREQMWKEKS